MYMATTGGHSAAHISKGGKQQPGATHTTPTEADVDYEALAPTWQPSSRLQVAQSTADANFVLEDESVAEVCNELLHGSWCVTEVCKASSQIVAVSTGLEKLTGFKAAELVGKAPSKTLHGPQTRPEAVAAWVSAATSQSASTLELTIHKKSGRAVPIREYIMPVSDSSGASWLCLEFVVHLADERKQPSAQEQQQHHHQQQRQADQAVQHNRYLEHVQQHAGALLITAVTPTSGVVVKSCSNHLASLTGYSQTELQESSFLALLGPDTSSSNTRHFLAAQLSGRTAVAKLLLYRKDGSPLWTLVATCPFGVQPTAATSAAGGAVLQQHQLQHEEPAQKQHVVLVVNITSNKQRRVGKYLLGRVLGQGASGLVRVGKNTVTDEIVAVKAVDATRFHSITEIEQVQEEMAVLATLKHQNIIRLLEVQFVGSCFYFIMEYASGGSMVRYIYSQEGGRLFEPQARQLFGQILSALEYCHKRRVIHRDLKPENILMDGDLPKIADFGLAGVMNTFSGTGFTLQCGTPEFTAPEIVEGKEYEGPAVDLWSVGVMLYEALSGHLPFKGSSQMSLFKAIQRGVYQPLPQSVSIEARDLVKRLLTVDPAARIGWSELSRHPWLVNNSPSTSIPARLRPNSMGQQTCTSDGSCVGSISTGNSSTGLSRLKSESIAGVFQDSSSGSGLEFSSSVGGASAGSGSGSDRFAANSSGCNQELDEGCQLGGLANGSGRSSCSQEEISDVEAGDAYAAAWVADALSSAGTGADSVSVIAAARLEAAGTHRIAASFTSRSCHESVRVVIPDSNQDDPITAAIKQRLAGGDCSSICSDSSSDHRSPNNRAYSFSGVVSPATPGGTRASQTSKTGLGKMLNLTSPSGCPRNSGASSTLPPLSPSGIGGGSSWGRNRHSVVGSIRNSSSGSGSPSSRARSGSTTSPLKERIKGSLLSSRVQGCGDTEGLPPISREKSIGRRGA